MCRKEMALSTRPTRFVRCSAWCADSTYGGIAFFATLGAQAAAAFWPGAVALAKRLPATLLASPLFSGLAGLLIGLHSGYWS